MEVKASSHKPSLSFSDASDPEDEEISEGEDDDRNHKHRKREALSQSFDSNSHDQGSTEPYRKRNKPYQRGYAYREGDPQVSETRRNFPSRFEKRRFDNFPSSRGPLYLNHQIRGNQMLPSETGPAWGRGREHVPWASPDSRLGLVDLESQMAPPGPFPFGLFARRDLSNVSNAQSTPWNAFGLVPGISNGGLDTLHHLGLQGALGPVRQRCMDFDERGFCLRGDMCPMEHGLNRIIVEDVQSLSQFNLPGSQLLATSSEQGALPVKGSSSGSLVNSKSFHAKSSKPGLTDGGLDLNGGVLMAGSDVYDPDQPLWANDNPETSGPLLALNQSDVDETGPFLDMESLGQQNIQSYEKVNDELRFGSKNSYVWGGIGSSKHKLGLKGKNCSVGTSSTSVERDLKTEALNRGPHQENWKNADKEFSLKPRGDSLRNIRKPSQKAFYTLFVSGVPVKDNRKESLLSHFQRFGKVVDIYIPVHSERAFVQFSNMEEAEAALKAPDAVLGNRFIKLLWANRDNILESAIGGATSVPITPHGTPVDPALPHPIVPGKEENHRPASDKDCNKPGVANGSKAPPPQKKLESLELMKEEIRKKREMLDQRRNEFKRQLEKLQKQAVGSKDLIVLDQDIKTPKVETPPMDDTKVEPSPRTSIITENTKSAEHVTLHASTSNPPVAVQESSIRPSIRPLAPLGAPFALNRFKLDNRPTAFRIASPLPAGLANVAALKEHFSVFGELAYVELEESELQEINDVSVHSNVSACVSFATRRFAEKAFLNGKYWNGHNLQFMWLTTINSGKKDVGSENLQESFVKLSDSTEAASTQTEKLISNNSGSEIPQVSSIVESDSGEAESTQSRKIDSLENDEPEILNREIDVEQEKDSESTSTSSLSVS